METINKLLLILLFLGFTSQSFGQLQIDHDRYKILLNEGKCDLLFNETKAIRISEEYGKNWIIDYYMATALCCSGYTDLALRGFNYILNEYPTNQNMNNLLVNSISSCKIDTYDDRLEKAKYIVNNWQGGSVPSAEVKGKLGFVLNCNKDVEVYEFNPEFDQSELQERLFDINETDSAINYYKNFLPNGKYNIKSSGRFVFITPSNKELSSEKVDEITNNLENAYQFMVNFYSVRSPNKLITVYLMRNKENLAEVAKETHGLTIPSGDYGYSCLADLSVLGNSSESGIGTILHELFHLIIRTDIGDIPGWLDEGIACLYEQAHWEDGKLVSNDNLLWRTTVLQLNNDTKNPLPILRTIIKNNWNDFTPNSATTICELAINYAMAKHFAMYMEEKDLLQDVVLAFKNRKNVFIDTSFANQNSVEIIENAIGDNLANIQKDFDNWLKRNYKVTTKRETYVIKKKIKKLHDESDYMCPGIFKNAEIMEEYKFLLESFNTGSSDMSDEVLERSIKFISKVEEFIIDCSPY